jgi:hypothetical protein
MKTGLPLILLTSAIVAGCSSYQARQEALQYQADMQQRSIAWYEAQTRLIQMCSGSQALPDCAPRYIKETPWTDRTDDWAWLTLPPYSTIVTVYEEAIRKRTPTPPLYIEYTIAAARYLGEKTDQGLMSPERFRAAFSEVWVWMSAQMQTHGVILANSFSEAQARDNQTWQTVQSLSRGLGAVLGAAVVAASARPAAVNPVVTPAYRPVSCNAVTMGRYSTRYTTIQCY